MLKKKTLKILAFIYQFIYSQVFCFFTNGSYNYKSRAALLGRDQGETQIFRNNSNDDSDEVLSILWEVLCIHSNSSVIWHYERLTFCRKFSRKRF